MVKPETIYIQNKQKRTGCVTVGEDKATITTLERSCVPDGLIQETGHTNRVRWRARTSHDKIGVSHVGHVVLAVQVLAIPARGEHQLHTDTITTVGIKISFVRHVVSVQSCLWLSRIVQAVEANGSLGENTLLCLTSGSPEGFWWIRLAGVSSSVSTASSITSNHAEIVGEGLHIVSVQQIVAKSDIISVD